MCSQPSRYFCPPPFKVLFSTNPQINATSSRWKCRPKSNFLQNNGFFSRLNFTRLAINWTLMISIDRPKTWKHIYSRKIYNNTNNIYISHKRLSDRAQYRRINFRRQALQQRVWRTVNRSRVDQDVTCKCEQEEIRPRLSNPCLLMASTSENRWTMLLKWKYTTDELRWFIVFL